MAHQVEYLTAEELGDQKGHIYFLCQLWGFLINSVSCASPFQYRSISGKYTAFFFFFFNYFHQDLKSLHCVMDINITISFAKMREQKHMQNIKNFTLNFNLTLFIHIPFKYNYGSIPANVVLFLTDELHFPLILGSLLQSLCSSFYLVWKTFFFFFPSSFLRLAHCIAQADLKLLGSGHPPASSWMAGIQGHYYCAGFGVEG